MYTSKGLRFDFIKHKTAEQDPDLIAARLCDMLASGPPIIALEKSLTITGLAQTLTYDAPLVSDAQMAAALELAGIEVAVQLNNLAIPNSDVKWDVKFLDVFGNEIVAMRQQVSGTASVIDGTTRVYSRFLPFQRNGSFTDGGAVSFEDGRRVHFPRFARVTPADLAALTAAVAPAANIWDDLRHIVSQVVVDIPAASITAGVVLTVTPITSGRREVIEAMIVNLDNLGAANSAPADQSETATKMQ